jgi:hypothetical protein
MPTNVTHNTLKKLPKMSLYTLMAGVAATSLCSCAALSTEIQHHHLKSESKMSHSIFLDPIADKDKVIYVKVTNTTSEKVDLIGSLTRDLTAKGWVITHDVDKAHDILQVNVLQIGQAKDPNAVWAAMNNGFDGAMIGGLAGLAAGAASQSVGTGIGVGIGVGAVSWLADQVVKDVTFSMITDSQISVRVNGVVTQTTTAKLSQGEATHTQQAYQQKTHWVKYRARIASVADQVNLKFDDAKPTLVKQVSQELTGIFD